MNKILYFILTYPKETLLTNFSKKNKKRIGLNLAITNIGWLLKKPIQILKLVWLQKPSRASDASTPVKLAPLFLDKIKKQPTFILMYFLNLEKITKSNRYYRSKKT